MEWDQPEQSEKPGSKPRAKRLFLRLRHEGRIDRTRIGDAVMGAAVMGVVIVVLVVLAKKKRSGKPALDDRDRPPGY